MLKKLFIFNIIIVLIGIILAIFNQGNKLSNIILLSLGLINIIIIQIKLKNENENNKGE